MKSIKKNYIYNLTYQILAIILPIITTPYIARTLGAEGVGTYSYLISITTYFILFGSLGMTLYGQREIAYNQKNEEEKTKIFWEINILRLVTMFISIIVFFFAFATQGQYSMYFKILLLELFATCLDISWFYQGIEEFKSILIRNILVKLVGIILIFTLIKTPADLPMYIIIYVINTFVSNGILWATLKKHLTKISIKDIKPFRHFKSVISFFIPQIAIQVYTVLDKTMIGAILKDMNEVGYYEQAQKIIKILLTIITSVSSVMLPRIANCFAEGKDEQISNYMKKTFNFIYFLSIPMIFGIIGVANNFVPFFFGDGYDKVVPIMSIMAFIIVFIGFSGVIGNQYLLTTKKQKEFTISVICGAVINFILNIVLIINYKSIGATIATVAAELSVTAVQLWFIRKEFNFKDIIKLSTKYVFSSVIMLAGIYLVNIFGFSNALSLIIKVIVGGSIYVTSLYILKDDFLKYVFDIIFSKFKRNKKNVV